VPQDEFWNKKPDVTVSRIKDEIDGKYSISSMPTGEAGSVYSARNSSRRINS
jgi:hypothetical protein